MQMTLKQVEDINRQLQSAKGIAKRAKEEAEKAIGGAVNIAETNAIAFMAGVMNGRFENPEVLGVPVDLGLGLLLQGASFFDIMPEHTRAVGNGLTCSYLSSLGVGIGSKMLAESRAAQAPAAP